MSQNTVFVTGMCLLVVVLAAILLWDAVLARKREALPKGQKTLLQ